MKIRNIGVVIVFFLTLFSCKEKEFKYSKFGGFVQGTTYSIVYQDNGKVKVDNIKTEVEKLLADFDLSLSIYNDSSVLSEINRNEEVTVDSFFTEAFRISQKISEQTDGAFDITVAPLVRAWGFGPEAKRDFNEAKRDSLLALIGMGKIYIKNNHLVKSDPRISLDFNAIAQGFSVDIVSRYLISRGLKEFLVEIGGEVRVKGDKGGKMWKIGIDQPFDNNINPGNNLQAIISLKDISLATSGNYRKFYIENGIKYSHTIDQKTGHPAMSKLLSATIIAKECAVADAVATACMVMGTDKAKEFISLHSEYEAYLIFSDDSGNFQTWSTEKVKKLIEDSSTDPQ